MISDSDEDDSEFSLPPPLHLSPMALLTGDNVISISGDSDSMLSSDTIDEESLSIDSDVESN